MFVVRVNLNNLTTLIHLPCH